MACGDRHTPRDATGKAIAERAFSGGLTFTTPVFIATAPNITPDVETGIGSWSDAEIGRAITAGIARDGHPLRQPMAFGYYAGLKAGDVADIVAWLRTAPPLQ